MAAPLDPATVVRDFLAKVGASLDHLPGPFDYSSLESGKTTAALPARIRGKLAKLQETETEITGKFVKERGELEQRWASRRSAAWSGMYSDLRDLDRKEEKERSGAREDWYCGLSQGEKAAFDAFCLAITESLLLPHIPSELPTCLQAALARLALEIAEIARTYNARRVGLQESLRRRGIDSYSGTKSFLHGLDRDEQNARSALVTRWLRELTPEQEAAFGGPITGQAAGSGTAERSQLEQVEWTTPDSPSRWAKLFGFSVDTLKRRFDDGTVRHKKLSSKSYQIAIDDLPAVHQAKFRKASNPPHK
jgi:hypothetical protein